MKYTTTLEKLKEDFYLRMEHYRSTPEGIGAYLKLLVDALYEPLTLTNTRNKTLHYLKESSQETKEWVKVLFMYFETPGYNGRDFLEETNKILSFIKDKKVSTELGVVFRYCYEVNFLK